MPLEKSGSNEARSENIRREIEAGKPAKQAEAIAYSVQRQSKDRAGGLDRAALDRNDALIREVAKDYKR